MFTSYTTTTAQLTHQRQRHLSAPIVKSTTLSTDRKIVTAHHLDDVVENWIFTALNGNPYLIPQERDNYIRPFLTTEKRDFTLWCIRKEVPTINDPSNGNTRYRRNYIRRIMMPHVEHINPGIKKTLRKKILDG
jgi:tRNA(Ile)-lysidine synthase